MAADNGRVELIQKLWDLAKKLQLTPEELRNGVLLSKVKLDQTAWQMAADNNHVELIENL
jgi:hypothetical protein